MAPNSATMIVPGGQRPAWFAQALLLIKVSSALAALSPTDPEAIAPLLEERKVEQMKEIESCRAFHDFQFTDHWKESRIQFEHHVVDDAGKYYKPVHYDHGCGIAAADVDGDGLLDLYFVTQLGSNELWRNRGNGAFEDITPVAGVALVDQISVAASFADIDNDGLPDLFVSTVRHGNHLFKNLGGGKFTDVTTEAGLGYAGHSSGAVFFDFDNDGKLDLFLCNVGVYTRENIGRGGYYLGLRDGFSGHTFPERTEYSLLYKNLGGGKFKEVSAAAGLRDGGWSGDATFADLNQDGWPDLYVLNMQGDDHYYENVGGKAFVEKTASYFSKTPWGAMGIKFFDFNQDGLMDLFVTDMHSDMTEAATRISKNDVKPSFEKTKSDPWCTTQYTEAYLQGSSNNIFGNAFYLNRGGGRFEEVAMQVNAETFWPWGVSVGDLNADGYPDAFVTAGMGFGFRYGVNSVLLNDGGRKFYDAEFALGVEPRAGKRTHKTAFVLDCSGADKDYPLCRGRLGQVPILEALSSRSSVICDLDGDGDLDVVTGEMDDRPQVLLSNLSERRKIHYLQVKLSGTKSNRDGLGSFVRVTAGGRTFTQYQDGKSGYFGQSSMPLYFGLGDAERVDKVEVTWPGGGRQVVEADVPINSVFSITEASL